MEQFRSRGSQEDRDSRRRRAGHGSPARHAKRILLLLALAASSLALTQCRMVGDRLTGVEVDLLRRKSDCVKACKDTFKEQKKSENDAHVAAIKACAGNTSCLAEEAARHQGALQAIDAAYVACQNGCHTQGGGTVGH
jgi:hypothetical protein